MDYTDHKKEINETLGLAVNKNKEDNSFLLLAKKTEKIVTALYMVTGYMDADEPIRNKLREHGVALVSDMAGVAATSGLKKEFSFPLIVNRISEIFSFMDIAAAVGLISDMNHKILKGEMAALEESLSKKQESYRIHIFEDLFTEDIQKDTQGQNILDENKRQIKAPSDFKEKSATQNFSLKNEKRILVSSTRNHSLKEKKNNSSENSTRKDIIIGLVKDKGEVTIKDISSVVSECSEKTIQRELLSLVNSNLLKRTGEKRWSKYSLM